MADDLDHVERDLTGVEQALARLDADTYFTCEVCGGALDDATLVAEPTRSRCAAHAG